MEESMRDGEQNKCDTQELLDAKTKLNDLMIAVRSTILLQDKMENLPAILFDSYYRAGGESLGDLKGVKNEKTN
jgi:hypothetical protein